MHFLTDLIVLGGLALFIGVCVLYVFLADRMVTPR